MFKVNSGNAPRTYIGGGVLIPNNSNLNDEQFLRPGRYYNAAHATGLTLINCPAERPFAMHVDSIKSENDGWNDMRRIIYESESTAPTYEQFVTVNRNTGEIKIYPWYKNVKELATIINTTD